MRTSLAPLLVVLFATTGCPGTSAEPTWQAESITDEGDLCIQGDADAAATVRVHAQTCLSSSCDRNDTATCSATVDGSTITVTAQFDWETATGEELACTDDCGAMIASCETGALPAGTYTIVMGSTTETIDIPTTDDCSEFGW